MRLPDLTPAELSDAQRALREQILGGPRGSGPQHFPLVQEDGSLTGPFGVMLHEPALGAPLQELGCAIRYATGLSARTREIAILAVASATGSTFEATPTSASGGPSGSPRTSWPLSPTAPSPRPTPTRTPRTRSAGGCWPTPAPAPGWTTTYGAYVAALGTTTLTELVVLVGYYRTLAQLLDVFDVGVPEE